MPSGARSERRRVEVGCLAGASALVLGTSFLIRTRIVPYGTGDADEGAYLNLADLLRHGRVTVPGSAAPFFRPWLTGAHGGHFFFQYEPGWPALLASADVIGSPILASSLCGVLVVLSVHALVVEVLGDRRTALVAAGLAACTPLFLLHAALPLAYLMSTWLCAATVAAALRASRLGSTAWALASGALAGALLLTRPFDAALTVLAAVVAVLVVHGRPTRARVLRLGLGALVGVVPFLVLAGWFNARTTGSWTSFPLSASDPRNTFGFGARGLQVGTPDYLYSFRDALGALRTNLVAAVGWLPGGLVGVALAVVACIRGAVRPRLFLIAAAALFPAAYLFWWATGLASRFATNGLGPYYYMPSFLPFVALIADGLVHLGRRRVAFAALAIVAGIGATAWNVPDKVANARFVTALFEPLDRVLPDDRGRSIVVVASPALQRFTTVDHPFLRTDPDLAGPVLYPADRHGQIAVLLLRHPGRRAYLVHPETRPGSSILEQPWVATPLRVSHGRVVWLQVEVHPPEFTRRAMEPFVRVDGVEEDVVLRGPKWTIELRTSAGRSGAVVVGPGFHDLQVGLADPTSGERWVRNYQVYVGRRRTVYLLRPGTGEHTADLGDGPVHVPQDVTPVIRDLPG